MAEDETSKLLPPLPRPLLSALSSLQNPLCPYAIDLEAPPPARKRRPGPDSPVGRRPPALASKDTNQPQQQQPLHTSFTFARSQSNQELTGTTANDVEPTTPTTTKKADEPVDEDSVILTIKASVFLRSHWLKEIGFWFLNFITAGLLALICRWYPTLLRKLRYIVVHPADARAEMVLVTSLDNIESYATILALDLTDLTQGWQPTGKLRKDFAQRNYGDDVAGLQAVVASPRMFIWRHERFWFNPRRGVGSGGGAAGLWLRRGFDLKRSYREIHRISAERLEETLVDDVALDRAFSRVLTYGENQLDVTTPPFPTLILHELLKPFFAFQLFSIVIWILQAYYIYMYVVVGLSVISIIQSAYAEHQNLRALERLAKADGVINKIRLSGTGGGGGGGGGGGDSMGYSSSGPGGLPVSGSISTVAAAAAAAAAAGGGGGASVCLTADPVATSSLQPGDIVHISTNMILPCDVLLLTGSVVMSEAMLTGESAPVLKSALPLDAPQTVFKPDSDRDGRYVLFSGTKVLQAKCGSLPPVPREDLAADGLRCLWEFGLPASHTTDHHHHHHRHHHHHHHKHAGSITFEEMPAMGLVLRTGFSTARGQLIRAILFPKPSKFNFERQTFLFMRILLLVLSIGIAFQVGIYHRNGVAAYKTFLDSLNLVTVAVPPALPLALSVGISVALARLKSYGIFCSDSSRISAAGRVNCLCFDKTGTLTTDGLTLKGVACVQHNHQQRLVSGMGGNGAASGNGGSSSSSSNSNNSNTSNNSSSMTTKTLGSELVTDVTRLHAVALEEGVRKAACLSKNNSTNSLSSKAGGGEGGAAGARPASPLLTTSTTPVTPSAAATAAMNLLKEEADPASNHKLMLSYVMAACHSISILDQTDDATALVLRLNSEIIADPSSLPERRQFLETFLEERGLLSTVEELVLDLEHDESILVKVEVEEEDGEEAEEEGGGGGGHRRQISRVGSLGGREGGSSGRHQPSYEEEDEEPVLDLPTMVYSDNVTEKTQHLVGDSLEILCFQESGWRYCVRPSEPPNLAELLRTMGPGALNRLFRDGAFDDFNIWRHPRLASYVDTVLLPPKSLKGTRHSSALAMVRRFDFDSDLRRMAAIIRTLPNLEPSGPGATATARKRGGGGSDFRYDQAGQHFLLVKGAPESITDICLPETLPVDLEVQLQKLTLSGYRVLACGTRALEHLPEGEMLKGTREELERGLTFVGLLVMENALKEETTGYLRDYARAGLRQIMVTGDNPLTALAVSKMAGSAFLCAWRRPLLVDLALDPGTMEMRLAVLNALDPSLKWGLMEYLRGNLGKALLTLTKAETEGEEEVGEGEEGQVVVEVGGDGGEGGKETEGGDGGARNGQQQQQRPPLIPGRRSRRSSSTSSSSQPASGVGGSKPAPALAAVDFVCTGRAFAALVTQHTPLREETDCDGEAWTALEVVLLKCNVFARMSPHNKQELMRSLQDLDYVVCMTGDGANDSGALKAADIGISIASAKNVLLVEPGVGKKEESTGAVAPVGGEDDEDEERQDDDNPENAKIATEISTAEAAVTAAPSIAAPFATGLHHIGAVCTVVTEGRGTLATSFSMFKYMFLYGIIQVGLAVVVVVWGGREGKMGVFAVVSDEGAVCALACVERSDSPSHPSLPPSLPPS